MIWILGNNGLLGSELSLFFTAAGIPWIGTGREVDVTDFQALQSFARGKGIRTVVNCVAYTSVERAEKEPDLCQQVNVLGVANISVWCSRNNAVLVHFSTDYVFSGTGVIPYSESDPIGPLGVYGRTKAESEIVVRRNCPRHIILRTSWLYGAYGKNFVGTMLSQMRNNQEIKVVADQYGSPTWTYDLARIVASITRGSSEKWGTYHASGEGYCSWYEFALAIWDEACTANLFERAMNCQIFALASNQFPSNAPRPAWSVLSKEKLRNNLGLRFPEWRESLRSFLKQEQTYT